MIATIRCLCIAGMITGLFTVVCLAGAYSELQDARIGTYTAPAGCLYAGSANGTTAHCLSCPLLPKQDKSKANLRYFRTVAEAQAAGYELHCCVQSSMADAASISTIPTTTPAANPIRNTSTH